MTHGQEGRMRILAVETSTEACSAALYDKGAVLERCQLTAQAHSRLILSMLESLLQEAGITLKQLDGLAFGCGPGSFTGVRIAAGVIQGIALGADLPVVPVSTLAALAQQVFDEFQEEYAFTALDARMGEIYWAVYQRSPTGLAVLAGEEAVCAADEVRAFGQAAGIGVGSGWRAYPEALSRRLGERLLRIEPHRYPRAGAVALLGAQGFGEQRMVSAERALPVYLRDQVAKKPIL